MEHVEDGLALATDAVNGLGIDSSTQGLLLDRLMAPAPVAAEDVHSPVALDRVLVEVRNLSSAINALVDQDVQTGGVKSAGRIVAGSGHA